MNWGSSLKTPNNLHAHFPAIMDEGNVFTDWRTACSSNNSLKTHGGLKTNYDYRQWLINNASSVMKSNEAAACTANCVSQIPPHRTNEKYLFKGNTDATQPFGYETSDLKNMYLNRNALNGRISAPIMTQYQMLQTGRQNYN